MLLSSGTKELASLKKLLVGCFNATWFCFLIDEIACRFLFSCLSYGSESGSLKLNTLCSSCLQLKMPFLTSLVSFSNVSID